MTKIKGPGKVMKNFKWKSVRALDIETKQTGLNHIKKQCTMFLVYGETYCSNVFEFNWKIPALSAASCFSVGFVLSCKGQDRPPSPFCCPHRPTAALQRTRSAGCSVNFTADIFSQKLVSNLSHYMDDLMD